MTTSHVFHSSLTAVLAPPPPHLEDLQGQLSGRRDDEASQPVRQRPTLPVQLLQHRHHEGQGLARAGLGGTQHVPNKQRGARGAQQAAQHDEQATDPHHCIYQTKNSRGSIRSSSMNLPSGQCVRDGSKLDVGHLAELALRHHRGPGPASSEPRQPTNGPRVLSTYLAEAPQCDLGDGQLLEELPLGALLVEWLRAWTNKQVHG